MIIRAVLLLSLLPAAVFPAEPSPPAERSRESRPSRWLWLLPGGGQFLLGEKKEGTAYAAGTLGLFGWGVYANGRKQSGELNAPFLYAQQVYVTGIYAAYRDVRLRENDPGFPWRLKETRYDRPPPDPTSVPKLALAPFKKEQLKSPWVWGSALAGAGLNVVAGLTRPGRRPYTQVGRVHYLGDSYNREWGTAAYTAYWVPASLGAGVAEEGMFRGLFQPEFEARWGKGRGLAAASGLFGIAHLDRPGQADSWGQVGFASLAGLYLGWRYQETGYKLSQSVAAHFWFDAAGGLALFFTDPARNPLGAAIQFAF